MKRFIILAALVLFAVSSVTALSSNLKDVYAPRETIIGEIYGSILEPISREQISLVRDGHIEMGFDFGIENFGERYFIWLNAPQNPGNYTLIIEDVAAIEQGFPQVLDFRKDFSVQGEQIDYSIEPGIIFADKDFQIRATLYKDFQESINVDFPNVKNVTLRPGVNTIDFQIGNAVGSRVNTITFGQYAIPAFIIGREYFCGDGQIDGKEVCDGENLGGKDCITIQKGFIDGNLACSNNCLSFDTLDCENEKGAKCDLSHLGLCNSSQSCSEIGKYWYNGACNGDEAETGCDSGHLSLCENGTECANAAGYWYDGKCNGIGGSSSQNFEFNPKIIRSTILLSEVPVYIFSIKNPGPGPLTNLQLGYDKNLFDISPSGNILIEPNASSQFNLTLKNVTGERIRGVISGRSGSITKYLLFTASFTSNETEVATDYLKNVSSDSGYYCSEIPSSSGSSCADGEICDGEEVSTLDVSKCCVGKCEKKPGNSKAWIGYLIAAILILVLLIIYFRYKKSGKKKDPMAQRVSEIEKKMP